MLTLMIFALLPLSDDDDDNDDNDDDDSGLYAANVPREFLLRGRHNRGGSRRKYLGEGARQKVDGRGP